MCQPIDDKKCECKLPYKVVCGCNICQRCGRRI
jgi:hypothetical protein